MYLCQLLFNDASVLQGDGLLFGALCCQRLARRAEHIAGKDSVYDWGAECKRDTTINTCLTNYITYNLTTINTICVKFITFSFCGSHIFRDGIGLLFFLITVFRVWNAIYNVHTHTHLSDNVHLVK